MDERDVVRDGRHLMENDGHEPEVRRFRHDWFWPADVALRCQNYAAMFRAPEHPNFREQYQRVGDATV
jgi:hypothetical protein